VNDHIAEVHAEINAVGRGKITVDGADVSGSLHGIEIVAGFSQPTRVVLHENAGVDLVIDGAVTIVRAQIGVLDFLDEIDPDDLEQRTLNMGHLDVAQAFIEAMKQIAREASGA
jgi:hypothetical protein